MKPITRSTYRKTATPVWTICHSVATISCMCTHLALCSLSFTCYRTPMLAGNRRNGTKQTKEITILDGASSLFLSFIPACLLLSSMVVCTTWMAFFIIHVSEEGHGGAEFFCFVLFSKKTTRWQGSNSDLRSEVRGIKSLATTYHQEYM